VEKRRGNVKGDGEGKGLPGPLSLSSHVCPSCVIIGPCHLVIVTCGMVVSLFCIGVVSLLGCVALSSLLVAWLCHCSASASLVFESLVRSGYWVPRGSN